MTGLHDEDRVKLLWTGGWDSTFRLLQLTLIEKRPAQPIYVIDVGRNSLRNEMLAMQAIRKALLPRLEDPSLLAPTLVVFGDEHPPPPHVVELGDLIRSQVKMGAQYTFLAGVAEGLGLRDVEMSVETPDMTAGYWVELVFSEPPQLRDTPEAALFKYWRFPITHLTKADMADIAREHGFLDLLELHWSCFDPLGGRPCGVCRPCTLNSMTRRDEFAPMALVRGRRLARQARRRARALAGRPRP
ncbi:hypothetical protein [Modestobacter sp. VKM Ac-2985]|uniref:hypothetical protein n=1 Tax=Modestobacter sp. VKM Ac-2985 TaxID=3004139 RepID=UPI0022AB6B51|nr:hypothetical protein [Modestobacter sp. VKM Ac-2985]MCZ2836024.1 hypothetical protein [Modestobacter sp. VKM Ac-2985]